MSSKEARSVEFYKKYHSLPTETQVQKLRRLIIMGVLGSSGLLVCATWLASFSSFIFWVSVLFFGGLAGFVLSVACLPFLVLFKCFYPEVTPGLLANLKKTLDKDEENEDLRQILRSTIRDKGRVTAMQYYALVSERGLRENTKRDNAVLREIQGSHSDDL